MHEEVNHPRDSLLRNLEVVYVLGVAQPIESLKGDPFTGPSDSDIPTLALAFDELVCGTNCFRSHSVLLRYPLRVSRGSLLPPRTTLSYVS